MFDKLTAFAEKNRDAVPRVTYIPLPEKQNRFQYVGGQVIDRTAYAIVNSAEHMMRYDLDSGKIDFIGQFPADDFKWTGGCVYDNKLYSFSRTQNSLLIYDPKKDSFEELDCGFSYPGEHHYGGVCTAEGVVYQPPRDTDHILRWDIKNRSCRKITVNAGQPCRYCGSVIHPNGYVYFIPEKGLCVMKMNPVTEEITCIGEPVDCMVFDPTVAEDGNIYGFSSDNGILKIDVEKENVSMLYAYRRIGAYGTKMGINGKLYSLPGYTNEILEFDPLTMELNTCLTITGENQVHYAGGVVDVNGDIYGFPVHADHILKIGFGKEKCLIPDELYEMFFVDHY